MWYSKDNNVLDMNKPIFAERKDGSTYVYVLMPKTAPGNYTVIGYDWFSFKNGTYNSCCGFKTVQEAIKSYYDSGFTIYNGTIKVERNG